MKSERRKIDYLVIARKKEFKEFCDKYWDNLVSSEREVKFLHDLDKNFKEMCFSYSGPEFEIKGKRVVAILDFHMDD